MKTKPLKVRVCTSKRCRACDSEKLLVHVEKRVGALPEKVNIKAADCLGHCGKKKRGRLPFAEVGEAVVAAATLEAILEATLKALKDRA